MTLLLAGSFTEFRSESDNESMLRDVSEAKYGAVVQEELPSHRQYGGCANAKKGVVAVAVGIDGAGDDQRAIRVVSIGGSRVLNAGRAPKD